MELTNLIAGPNGNKISGMIERGVRLMHEQATLAEDLKCLLEDSKEEYGTKPAELKKVIQAAFDEEILVKKREEVEALEGILDAHKQRTEFEPE